MVKIAHGGLLIVDDIDVSEGFDQLSDSLTRKQRLVVGRVGILKKRSRRPLVGPSTR